ncbi:MAG: F0F1 ATP synthase subunit A [Clostridiales bacterium]|nr:F0F1 ATP synthase subunit A [Clostridiales bacterium]MDY5703213.1 F0F1 ATP synthase subunit A [Eubacteriales bacterium]
MEVKKKKDLKFILTDILLLIGMLLPIAAGLVLKVLTEPASEGISITGANVYFTIKMPIQDLPISEAQVNSVIVVLAVLFLCLFLTHGIKERPDSIRQHIAEYIVEQISSLVSGNMGERFGMFAPFVAAIMGISVFSSLLTLVGLFPPTSDINITAGWAILVFILITHYKLKCGPIYYLKGFAEPIPLFAPLNVIGEIATPVSMAFRHYGNVLSGSVISVLVAAALQGLSAKLLSWLPGALAGFPLFQIGLPAVLSIYFDVFSGCLQAFIFAMLTMLYISNGFPEEDYIARQRRKDEKKRRAMAIQAKLDAKN